MKKLMWAIAIIGLIGTAIALQFIPESVPMHYDMAGNIDRWGSKYENLWLPAMVLLTSLFWTLLIGYYERKARKATEEKVQAGAKANAKVLRVVGVAMAAMFTVMQGFSLYGSYREAVTGAAAQAVDAGRLVSILLGAVYVVLGNVMTKTRINGVVGVKTHWSMYNDNTWRKSNRFGAYGMVAAGVLTVIVGIFAQTPVNVVTALASMLLVAIAAVIYADKVYRQERKAENK